MRGGVSKIPGRQCLSIESLVVKGNAAVPIVNPPPLGWVAARSGSRVRFIGMKSAVFAERVPSN
jgi:hypothetical protein